MSKFNINYYAKKQEFHRFTTDDFALIGIGIGNYNISSLANFFDLNVEGRPLRSPNPDLLSFFETSPVAMFNILSGSSPKNLGILEFDHELKTYVSCDGLESILRLNPERYPPSKFKPIKADNIKDFLKQWDDVQTGIISSESQVSTFRAVVYKIQNSASGCITFDVTYPVLGENKDAKIKLSIMESRDSQSDRSMSFKGAPFITSPGKTSYNATYSQRATSSAPEGAYVSTDGDEDNPENNVSGKMRLTYDSSIGEWHSGTQQILARLLEDVPTADIPEFSAEALESLNREDYYGGSEAAGYMGNFTKGVAIPLSAENGNPYLFGPDFKDGCTGDNKAKITAINRLNNSYRAGDIVVLSQMSGENGNWVIVSPGSPEETKKKLTFGNFEYQQFLTPTISWFKATDPNGNTRKIELKDWSDKIRADYYYRLATGGSEELKKNSLLNIAIMTSDVNEIDEDKEQELTNFWLDSDISSLVSQANDDRMVTESLSAFDYINNNYCGNDPSLFHFLPPKDEHTFPYPKNVSEKTILFDIGAYPTAATSFEESSPYLRTSYAPCFWGTLFPDGYKSETARLYKDITDNIPIYEDDPKLKQMSSIVTSSLPYFNDAARSINLAKLYGLGDYRVITKTGGFYTYLPSYDFSKSVYGNNENSVGLQEFIKVQAQQNSDTDEGENPTQKTTDFGKSLTIKGLEPANPRRIQFSSLSIETLYSGTTFPDSFLTNFSTQSFGGIARFISNMKQQYITRSVSKDGEQTQENLAKSYYDYAGYWMGWDRANLSEVIGTTNVDQGVQYNLPFLSFKELEDNFNFLRTYSSADGVLFNYFPPLYGDNFISPCIPVTTVKSNITTNAESLRFTTDQYFGEMPRLGTQAGESPNITVLGALISFATGGSSGPQNISYPQWGSRSSDSLYDPLGTTMLYVRGFDHWSEDQTIYLGPIYTPLHFSESPPAFEQKVEFDENDNPVIVDTDQPYISTLDFRVPTSKNGTKYKNKDTVPEKGLAEFRLWKYSKIRRNKLVSNGGFAYFKHVLAINSISIDAENRGSGYKIGEELIFNDGSTFKVTEIDQENGDALLDGVFEKNFAEDKYGSYVIKRIENFRPITSFDGTAVPSSSDGSGTGAKFKATLTVAYLIQIDKGPREIVPLTRISKSSDQDNVSLPGSTRPQNNAPAYGDFEITVDLPEEDRRHDIDLYYFYANDPTHYTMDEGRTYTQGYAQFVNCEVNPA